jgi:Fe-S cluster biosynthesis and repair protein YggX
MLMSQMMAAVWRRWMTEKMMLINETKQTQAQEQQRLVTLAKAMYSGLGTELHH